MVAITRGLFSLLASSSIALADDASWISFTVDDRNVDAHVPACANSDSPIILSLHAWASNVKTQKTTDRLADLEHPNCAVVLYPQGKLRGELFGAVGWSWNAGGCCPNANRLDYETVVDDVTYIDHVIDAAAEKFGVNADLTFAIGLSNGGMMVNRLACSLDRIKAIAAVSGPLVNGTDDTNTEPFACPRSVPVLHFHGDSDPVVPFGGCNKTSGGIACQSLENIGNFAPLPDVPDYIDGWRNRNGATGDATQTYQNGDVTCDSWGNTASNVTFCKIKGEGHAYPNSCPLVSIVPMFHCTRDIDASVAALEFFKQFIPASTVV